MSAHDDEFPLSNRRPDQASIADFVTGGLDVHWTLSGTAPSTPYGVAGTAFDPELSNSGAIEISAVAEPMELQGPQRLRNSRHSAYDFGDQRCGLSEADIARCAAATGDEPGRFTAFSPAEEPLNLTETAEAVIVRYIRELRANEGASISILCDNPEAITRDLQCAIEVMDDWTDWEWRRFHGESLLQCLAKAAIARDEAQAPAVGPEPEWPHAITLDLSFEQKNVLELMATAGIVGGTPAEVALYLIVRSLDDMMRQGVLKLGGGRDDLVSLKMAERFDGWQSLTAKGLEEAIARGFDRKKGW